MCRKANENFAESNSRTKHCKLHKYSTADETMKIPAEHLAVD